MGKVEKYLNIAKTAIIKTPNDIDGKILEKLENLDKEDRLLLDEDFLEYLKKNNSRIYLFNEKIKNNQVFPCHLVHCRLECFRLVGLKYCRDYC